MGCLNPNSELNKFALSFGISSPQMLQELVNKYEGISDSEATTDLQNKINSVLFDGEKIKITPSIDKDLASGNSVIKGKVTAFLKNTMSSQVINPEATGIVYQVNGEEDVSPAPADGERPKYFFTSGMPISISSIIKIKKNNKTLTLRNPEKSNASGEVVQYLSGSTKGKNSEYEEFIVRYKSPFEEAGAKGKRIPVPMTLDEYIAFKKTQPGFEDLNYNKVFSMFMGDDFTFTGKTGDAVSISPMLSHIKDPDVRAWFSNPDSHKRIVYEISRVTNEDIVGVATNEEMDKIVNSQETGTPLKSNEVLDKAALLQKAFPEAHIEYQLTSQAIPGSTSEEHIIAIMNDLSRRFGISYNIDNTISVKGMFDYGTNTVTINPSLATPDTLWHEFIHPFIDIIETNNPALFNDLINEIKRERKGIIAQTYDRYPNYRTLDGKLSLEGYKEALVEVLGRESEYVFSDYYEIDATGAIVEQTGGVSALKRLIQQFYRVIANIFNTFIDDPSIVIQADMLPTMTVKSLAHIIGGTRNEVNVIGAASLSVPKKKQDEITSVVNRISKSLSGLIAITESRLSKSVAGGNISAVKDLKISLTKSKIMSGILSSVYYSQSHYSDILKKYDAEYAGMNTLQRLDFLREATAVIRTFDPLTSMNKRLFEGVNFPNKAAFMRALLNSNDLNNKITNMIKSEVKRAYEEFVQIHQTSAEAARFSIEQELNTSSDISIVELYLGAMASSPDYISALHNRVYTKTLKENNEELESDVAAFIKATDDIIAKGYKPEDILTEKNEKGENLPFLITDVDREFFRKKEELLAATRDHIGEYLEYSSEETPEALLANKSLKAKKEALEKFLAANTEVNPDTMVEIRFVGGQPTHVPLASFKERVLSINPFTGEKTINPLFEEDSINKVFDEYFVGRERHEITSSGKVGSKSKPFSYPGGHKVYNYENFTVRSEYKRVKLDKFKNTRFEKMARNQDQLNYYNAYLNFVNKYKEISPIYAHNKNMLPVMESESVRGWLGAKDKSAYAKGKYNEFKAGFTNNISAEQNSIDGHNAPTLPMFFKSKFSEQKNRKVEELYELLKSEEDEAKVRKIQEEIKYLMTFVDYKDVDFSSVVNSAVNFASMVHDNNNRIKIEAASLILLDILENRAVHSKSLITNDPNTNLKGETNTKTSSQDNRTAKQMREFIDRELYQLGDPDEGSFAEVAGTSITKTSSYIGVALNPKSSFFNLAMGHMNNLTEAVGGLFYNTSHLVKAKAEFNAIAPSLGFFKKGNQRDPLKVILDELSIFTPNHKDDRFRNMSQNTYSKLMISDMAFALDNFAEYAIQSQVAIAMMESHIVDVEGEILSFSDFKKKYRGGTRGQFDAMPNLRSKLEVENGKIKYQVSEEQLDLWKQRTKGVIQLTHGRYTKEDAALISRYWWGRMLLQFKRWVGATIEERFKRQYYDVRLREDMEGRYRTFGKFILAKFVSFKEAEAGAMDWSNLSDAEKGNIRKALMDAGIIAFMWGTVSILGNVLKGMGDDDEEGTAKYAAINFMRYSAMRIKQETSTLINPFEWKSFTTNPVASMRTLSAFVDFSAEGVSAVFSEEASVYQSGQNEGEKKYVVKFKKIVPSIPFFDYWENLFKKPIDFYKQTK